MNRGGLNSTASFSIDMFVTCTVPLTNVLIRCICLTFHRGRFSRRGLSAFNLRSIMDVCGVDAWNEVLTLHKQSWRRSADGVVAKGRYYCCSSTFITWNRCINFGTSPPRIKRNQERNLFLCQYLDIRVLALLLSRLYVFHLRNY